MKENPKKSTPKTGEKNMQVMLTQVVFCAVLLLFALIVRLIGGGAFGWLTGAVNKALQDDSLLTGLSSRFYGTVTTTTTTVEPIVIESTVNPASTDVGVTSDNNTASDTSTTHAVG